MLELSEGNYSIEKDYFRGSIKTLLELIQKKKINIYDINLSDITSDFLNYLNKRKEIPLGVFSGFIYIASILVELKTRFLIPSENRSEDFEDQIKDPEVLKLREREYAVFSSASDYLDYLISNETIYLEREAPTEDIFIEMIEDFYNGIEIKEIAETAAYLLRDKPKEIINFNNFIKEVTTKTLTEEINRIEGILSGAKQISFRELTVSFDTMIDKIICFLSILEMYKNGKIDILQFENFGNIMVQRL
jgi:segregation and condensation protein A